MRKKQSSGQRQQHNSLQEERKAPLAEPVGNAGKDIQKDDAQICKRHKFAKEQYKLKLFYIRFLQLLNIALL